VKFYYFHLMPYRMEHDEPSSWVTLSNRHYDPEVGRVLYNQYLDQFERAEQLGWDGLCVNEHHQNCYGTMPSPNLMAAMLARRTSRAKIAILGNGLPLRENPLRIAEEIAMLDVVSGGRIISGFVRGIGPEYFSTAFNPTHSRDRFLEAAELIVRAWTEPGPFPFDGRFYRFPYVNPWPRPLQKPHPPVWCPSQGSTETVDWAAKRRYPYLMVFTPLKRIAQIYGEYREACERHGYKASRYQLTVNLPIVVAENDEKARRIAEQNALWVYHVGLRIPLPFWQPPGYLTEGSFQRMMQNRPKLPTELTFEDLQEGGYIICGSPATVRDRLRVFSDELQAGIVCSGLAAPTHEATLDMMEMFAREVMPHFRQDAEVDETAGVGR
jgi:alkanesulfonate monooxygenase SsuD/methylene tetrahydromethanopterin reductase-like flavin-dependent oxidoreductase (luciferase family)